jgi:tetratricopeptide (TPR) repeat protein
MIEASGGGSEKNNNRRFKEWSLTAAVETTPQPKSRPKSHPMVKTIIIVSTICFFAAANLDVPAEWLSKHDNLLEAIYCYQIMTSTCSLLGSKSWRVGTAYTRLASCYSRMGRNQEAIFAGKQARAIMSQLMGEQSSNVCLLDAELAEWMTRGKDYTGAEKLLKSTLQDIDRVKPANPAVRAYALSVLLDTYMEQQDYAKAEEIAGLLIPVDEEAQRTARQGTYGSRQRLVETYCRTKRLALAEQTAKDGLVFADQLGEPMSQCDAHDSLGRVRLAQGQVDDARREFDQAINYLQTSAGANDNKVALWKAHYQQMLEDKNPYPDRN